MTVQLTQKPLLRVGISARQILHPVLVVVDIGALVHPRGIFSVLLVEIVRVPLAPLRLLVGGPLEFGFVLRLDGRQVPLLLGQPVQADGKFVPLKPRQRTFTCRNKESVRRLS